MSALPEFIQDGIRYVPTKAIAKSVGLSPDYLTRFCRERAVAAVFHKGAWYVNEAATPPPTQISHQPNSPQPAPTVSPVIPTA